MSTKPRTRTNRILIGTAAMVGVFAGAAGISAAVTSSGSDPAPGLPRAEAEAVATAEVPGTVVGIEAADDGDDREAWTVDVEDADGRRHEVEIDDDGQVVGRDVDDDDDGRDDDRDGRDDEVFDPAEATVTQDEAEAAALAEVPGTVRGAHLEREDGRLEWDVDVDGEDGRRHDLQIDAETGTVLERDTDD